MKRKNRTIFMLEEHISHNIVPTFLLPAFFLILVMYHSPVLCSLWEQIGPDGGNFIFSVTNPEDANQVTAITTYPSPSNVYRSVDAGINWRKIGQIPNYEVSDVTAFDFSTLYAISRTACYNSIDGGANWTVASLPASMRRAHRVCVDPTNSSKVYAVGYQLNSSNRTESVVLFKSIDGGINWTASSFFSFDSVYVSDMAISRSNPDVLYIAGNKSIGKYNTGALFKSTNGGAAWMDISSSVDNEPYSVFYSVAVDPFDSEKVYVGGSYRFYRTVKTGRDNTVSWNRVPIDIYPLSIGVDPVGSSRIYVAGIKVVNSRTIYSVGVSTDYGVSWTLQHDCVRGDTFQINVAHEDPSRIYLSTYFGLFKSSDSGYNWTLAHEGIHATRITALAVAPSRPSTVIVEYDRCGLMGSYDRGDNWDYLGYFVGCGNVCDILINPDNADAVLALEGFG
jgi:photosystem II stability/assembly factor-like uncharacterized protein